MEDEERLFNCDIEAYIADRIGFYQNTTLKEQGRKLRYFGQIFGDLREEGKIGTEDPAKIGPAEISAFLQHMRDKGIDVATQSKYIQVLNNYLVFKDNMIISKMKGSRRFPSPAKKPIKSLSVDEVQHIFDTVQEMDGWTGTQARGIVALAFETLARPSELRLAQARDLDLTRGRFFVRNPKGKGSYASGQWVDLIRPDVRKLLWRYVDEREIYLAARGKTSPYLFPNILRPEGYFSSNAFRNKMRVISKRAGVDFSLKDFRSTGTNLFISVDKTLLNAMSAQLRHSDIGTTQRFYADIQSGHVADDLGDKWKKTAIRL